MQLVRYSDVTYLPVYNYTNIYKSSHNSKVVEEALTHAVSRLRT